MNELMRVEEVNGRGFVNARELHATLGVGRDFPTWIKERIERYGFIKEIDYQTRSPVLGSEFSGQHGGQNRVDYLLSVPMAKELAIVENNDKGREVRRYLIQVEEAWNAPELVFSRALQMANKLLEESHKRIALLEPKAEFFDQVADSKDALSMRDVAAVLNIPGVGRKTLFKILRDNKVLDGRNVPYRKYQEKGYFRVVEWENRGHVNLQTLVYQKGVEFIRRVIKYEQQQQAIFEEIKNG